jgi:hypothetical protein
MHTIQGTHCHSARWLSGGGAQSIHQRNSHRRRKLNNIFCVFYAERVEGGGRISTVMNFSASWFEISTRSTKHYEIYKKHYHIIKEVELKKFKLFREKKCGKKCKLNC